ncbi:MAG: TetR/AcrR family transcriptional regulator [Beijerinckiaceae bacterium]|nr:TetR/AcrR family transcriptional regulator [Beijerinckiaceae bacterium]
MNQHTMLQPDHRTRILDAAHRCFVRSGFHRATMQDVAMEAGMSAGNIYRYFASKDAIVAGLSARDRADIAQSFSGMGDVDDPFAAMMAVARRYLVDDPREKAIFLIDLWVEATRNEGLAAICRDCEDDIKHQIGLSLTDLVDKGRADPRLDITALVDLLMCLSDGLFARRAREPDFDAAPHMNHLGEILRLACSGQVQSVLRCVGGPLPVAPRELGSAGASTTGTATTANTVHDRVAASPAAEDVT